MKIDFSKFSKRASDVARSEPSDQIAINDRGEEATWQREERPIACGFSAIDLHLSEEGYVARSGSPEAF